MNLTHRVASDIVPPELYYSVGQGALGIEIRSDDEEAKVLLKALSDRETEMMGRAERACLRVLEGGCSVPVGVQSSYSVATASGSSSPSSSSETGRYRRCLDDRDRHFDADRHRHLFER